MESRVHNSTLKPSTFFCHMRPSFGQNFCCPQHVKNVPSTKIFLENEPWERWSMWRMYWPNLIFMYFRERTIKIVTKFFFEKKDFWIFFAPSTRKKRFLIPMSPELTDHILQDDIYSCRPWRIQQWVQLYFPTLLDRRS